jgi:MFS family permease
MFKGLWRDREFARLWSAQAVSVFGTQITFLALPLVAVITLDATPFQIGALAALGAAPALLVGLLVGAWVDKRSRRPLMIACDWGRAALIGLVPLAWALDFLSIGLLFAVAFGAGALTLVFDVAYRSYLPALVGRERLVDANSQLELSRSAAEVAGPGTAGLIVQFANAPVALIVDAVTFVLSALSLHGIRLKEDLREVERESGSLFADALTGLAAVWANPVSRALILNAAMISLFNAMFEAVYLLYAVRELGVNAGLIGLISAAGGGGFVAGAMASSRAIQRVGIGRSIIAANVLVALSDLVLPLAGGSIALVVCLLIVGQVSFGLSLTVFNVGQISLRQQTARDGLQGRTHAAFRVVAGVGIPVGALFGGLLGETIGLRSALFIGVAGEAAAVIWLIASPIPSLRKNVDGSATY